MSSSTTLKECISSANTGLDAIKRAPIVERDTGIKCIRIQDISQSKEFNNWGFTEVTPENFKKFQLKKDDILIARTGGSIGVNRYISKDLQAVYNNGLIRIRVDTKKYYPKFVYYLLRTKSFKQHINSIAFSTAAQPNMKIRDFLRFEFMHLDLEQQIYIADMLSNIDDKIELNRQINQTVEQIAQAIFKSWFVDFEPVKAKINAKQNGQDPERAAMRTISGKTDQQLDQLSKEQHQQLTATAALFPDELEDSELGEIPKGWGERRIDEILELAYGKALKKTDRNPGDIPVYGSGGVTGLHHVHLVEGPGIIVGRKGTVGSLYWEDSNFFPIDTVFYVILKEGFSLDYVYYLLQTLGLESMNTDAAVPGLNRNNVYRLTVAGHPLELVEIYSTIVNAFNGKISANKTESFTLIELRDSLLPKLLFSGFTMSGNAA